MDDEENLEWVLELFNKEEIETLMSRAGEIEDDMLTVYDITLSVPREEAITLCRKFESIQNGAIDLDAMQYVASMVAALVETVRVALEADGIDPSNPD